MYKHGWNHGKGLGKTEQGRVAHVRVKKRPHQQGLGQHDEAGQWWETLYNVTAQRMIHPDTKEEEKGGGKKLYLGMFVKGGLLAGSSS